MTRTLSNFGRWECAPGADDLVVELFQLMEKDGVTMMEVERRSGVSSLTMRNWKHALSAPSVQALRKVLDAIGYRLEIV